MSFEPPKELIFDLEKIEKLLFVLSADFATPLSWEKENTENQKVKKIKRINEENIAFLENKIDEYYSKLPEVRSFVIPGGSKVASFLNQARTVCRRAERIAIKLSENEDLTENSLKFLNRLSDYFFAAMRYANLLANYSEKVMDFSEFS